MPGVGYPVGGGVQATDDGKWTLLPGAKEGTGTVQRVRGGDGRGFFGGAQDEEQGKHGQEGRHQNALFYVGDGTVALLDRQWLQGAFSILVGLFDRVVLRTNIRNTVGMVCRP